MQSIIKFSEDAAMILNRQGMRLTLMTVKDICFHRKGALGINSRILCKLLDSIKEAFDMT